MLGLFGCEYRSGRAAAAPLLRPLDAKGQPGGHLTDSDPLPTFAAETVDAPHDGTRLPHMYPDDDIVRPFPTIVAAPEVPNVDDYNPRRDDNDGYLRPGMRGSDSGPLRGEHRADGDRKKISRQPPKKAAQ